MNAFDPTLPLSHARTLPAAWYFDASIAEREARAVFHRTWQILGRAEQVAEPGDYFTANLAGEPLLIVRSDDGVLRGFFNVCRHRAAPILTEPCGHATKLRCRYHGWTYDLAGQLKGTPEFEGVEDFDKRDNGLVPVRVAECGPFVGVHLGGSSDRSPLPLREGRTIALADHLAPFPQWATDGDWLGNLKFHARREYDLACNWKVYVDNYLDGGYHVSSVHPALADALDYRGYTTTTHGFTALQSSPLKPAERTRGGDVAAYWWAYPNFMANLYRGVMDTNLVLPLGPKRCRVVFDFYFAAGTEESYMAESIAVAERVQLEDVAICEEVQRGLHSRSFSTGRFSKKRENAGYHFHKLLFQSLADPA